MKKMLLVKMPVLLVVLGLLMVFITGCVSNVPTAPTKPVKTTEKVNYLIGPGDIIDIFVWRNPDVSVTVPVRPDGQISTPLVEDMVASGKTPTQLGRDIEKVLSTYIKEPIVTVIVEEFRGDYSQQIRIVGEAAEPGALPYRNNMTVLDVMISVGGLTEFASGNRARIVRKINGESQEFRVYLEDLMRGGHIDANVEMQAGDILIIPEAWF